MEKKTFKPSPEQFAFHDWVENGSGSAVLEAVAGAGKTTTLVEAVKLMKGSIFLGAYNKKMGVELQERVKEVRGAKAGTFHAAGYSALRRVRDNLEIDDKKVRNIAEQVIEDFDISDEDRKDMLSAICKLVSLAKQTGFYVKNLVPNVRPAYWVELINRHDILDGLPEHIETDSVVFIANKVLIESNQERDVIDFDDMVYLPLLLDLRMFQNDWVLIDEAQDTNAVRRALAAKMLRRGGRLIAVGDPHQAIYGFTGADNDSLDLIKRDFKAITMNLSVSWRCPQAVVAVAREYVDHIRPAPTAALGAVSAMSYTQMLQTVAPGQAVICRFNVHLVDLCFRLIREGKPAKIEGRSIGEGIIALVSRWKVKTLDALENKLTKWIEKEVGKLEAAAKVDEGKIEKLRDKHATVMVLVERAREQQIDTVTGLKEMISNMFADVGSDKTLIVLSSVHRSKGLEWPVVHILGRGDIMPPKREMQDWQYEQEINLCYVAITRAQETLIDVALPTPEELKKKAVEPKKEAA